MPGSPGWWWRGRETETATAPSSNYRTDSTLLYGAAGKPRHYLVPEGTLATKSRSTGLNTQARSAVTADSFSRHLSSSAAKGDLGKAFYSSFTREISEDFNHRMMTEPEMFKTNNPPDVSLSFSSPCASKAFLIAA